MLEARQRDTVAPPSFSEDYKAKPLAEFCALLGSPNPKVRSHKQPEAGVIQGGHALNYALMPNEI